ncbi:hypothetical protein TNCV_336431 [Trichonephila clavipes]|nr:hypothetical protein TNCV_336431 [Trichonephila clavipes]
MSRPRPNAINEQSNHMVEMLPSVELVCDNILKRLITTDEAWLYHYDPTIKKQSSERKHPSSPTPKKAKTVKSAEAPFIIYSSNARAWLLDDLPPSMDRRRRLSGIHRVKGIRAGGRHPLWHGHRAGRNRLSLQIPRKRNHSVQGFH